MGKLKDYLTETMTESIKVKGMKQLHTVLKNIDSAKYKLYNILDYVEKNFKIKDANLSMFQIDSGRVYLHVILPEIPLGDYDSKQLNKGEADVKKMGGKWLLSTGDLYIEEKF